MKSFKKFLFYFLILLFVGLYFFNKGKERPKEKAKEIEKTQIIALENKLHERIQANPNDWNAQFEMANFYISIGKISKATELIDSLSRVLTFSVDQQLYAKVELHRAELLFRSSNYDAAKETYQNLSQIDLKYFRKLREVKFILEAMDKNHKELKLRTVLSENMSFSTELDYFRKCVEAVDEASTHENEMNIEKLYSYYRDSKSKKIITFFTSKTTLINALTNGDPIVLLNQFLDENDHPVVVTGYDSSRDIFIIKDFALQATRRWISAKLIVDFPALLIVDKERSYPDLEKESKWTESVLSCIVSTGEPALKLKELEHLCLNLQYNAVTATARWRLKEEAGEKDIQLMRVAESLNYWSAEPALSQAYYYFEQEKLTLSTGWLLKAERKEIDYAEIKKLKLLLYLKGEKHFLVEELYRDYKKVKDILPVKQCFDIAVKLLLETGRLKELNELLEEFLAKLEDKQYLNRALELCLNACYNPSLAMNYLQILNSKAELIEKKLLLNKQKEIERIMKKDDVLRKENKYYALTDFENLGLIKTKKLFKTIHSQPREALPELNRASFYNPDGLQNIKALAILNFRAGEYEHAAKAFKKLHDHVNLMGCQKNWLNIMATESFYRAGNVESATGMYDPKAAEIIGIRFEKEQLKKRHAPISLKMPKLLSTNELALYSIEKCGIQSFTFSGNFSKDLKKLEEYKHMYSGIGYLTVEQIKRILKSGFPVFKADYFNLKFTVLTGYDENRNVFLKTMDSHSSLPICHLNEAEKIPCMYIHKAKQNVVIEEGQHDDVMAHLASLALHMHFGVKLDLEEKRSFISALEASIDKESDLYNEYLYQLAYTFLEAKSGAALKLPFKKGDEKADWIKAITMMTLNITKTLSLKMIVEKLDSTPFDHRALSSAILYLQHNENPRLSMEISKALQFVFVKNEYLLLHLQSYSKYAEKKHIEKQATIVMDHNLGLINKFKLAEIMFKKGSTDFAYYLITYLEKQLRGSKNKEAVKKIKDIKKQVEDFMNKK